MAWSDKNMIVIRTAPFDGFSSISFLVYGIMALALLIHLPRFVGAFARYCGPKTPLALVFTKSQFERVARIVGRSGLRRQFLSPSDACCFSGTRRTTNNTPVVDFRVEASFWLSKVAITKL